ncbi:unnamed protein product [Rotaria sp. Silwood1]|nr:unnamed protein product [Rotaria sp. Silwood1]CAF4810722.1 unnamed protein product [Rotaria sp. Silwood1]
MHIAFAVFFLLIAHVVSYPSLREHDFELELRSILNHLDNEKMERSVASDEDTQEDDSDQDKPAMNKRQGGYNVIDQDLKCEIECVDKLRNPQTGQGMSIRDAAKACKNICGYGIKKREQKKTIAQQKEQPDQKTLRELTDDDSSSSNKEQQKQQLRELSNYLMKQFQLNDNE